MLNKLLERLNGDAGDATALAQELEKLGHSRIAARTSLKDAHERRRQALLDDVSDAGLDKLEREIARVEVRLEKLDLAEPMLRERLAAATAEARRRRWLEHRSIIRAADLALLSAARAVVGTHTARIGHVEDALREGFGPEVAAEIPKPPNLAGNMLCAADLLDLYELAVAGAAQVRVPAQAGWAAARKALALDTMQHAVTPWPLDPRPAKNLTAPRTPDDFSPLEPGEARVRALHNGWSPANDRQQCAAGQVVRMPAAAAKSAADHAAVQILETYGEPRPTPGTVVGGDWTVVGTVRPDAAHMVDAARAVDPRTGDVK